jgi:serine/threonine protein kinase/tetratricopeptide (TPR) repeat protein/TolB-like protein
MDEFKPEYPDADRTADTRPSSKTFDTDVTATNLHAPSQATGTATPPISTPASPLPSAPAFNIPPHAAFQPNQVLAGRFKVIRFIARGGMGEVYEAEDEELNERVAVKTARFDSSQSAQQIERFRREIQLARKVTHPNVCRTFDVFRHGTTPLGAAPSQILIVSMELLSGETLDRRVRGGGELSTADALPIVLQMCAGLGAAHRVGVTHRDFKSANVMLVPGKAGESTRAVVTDFGLAHAEERAEHTLTQPGDIVGTPSYMSPEQIEGGAITPATDIYALGIVIYEMLTGKLPFAADTPLATAMKRLNEPAPHVRSMLPNIDAKWDVVIARCLERQPSQRFASTDEIARALQGEAALSAPRSGVLEESGLRSGALRRDVVESSIASGSAAQVPRTFWHRLRFPLAVAALFVIAATLGGWWWVRHRADEAAAVAQATQEAAANGARKSVAILGFQNLSGKQDADALGNILSDSLWSQLDTDELRVIPPARVDEMKQNLHIGVSEKSLSRDQVAAIRKFLGADVLVLGSYTVNGSPPHENVQWNVHLLNGSNGESSGSVSQSGNAMDLDALVVHSGRLLRQKLGVTLSPGEESRMDASLSANADAMRFYSDAREKLRQFDVLSATKLLEKATEADPQFAQAHSALAEAWDALGFDSKAAEEAKKAVDAAKGLSTEARSRTDAQYFAATRDWPKAIQQYAQLWTQYRDEPEYGVLLAKAQVRGGKAADALTTLAQIQSQSLPPGVAAQTQLTAALAHDTLADYKQELSAATKAADQAQALGANLLLARARSAQCHAHVNLGSPDSARPLCEEAKKINVAAGDQLGTARSTNDMANAYYAAGNVAAAEPLYQEALSIAQTIGDATDEAGALNNLANIASDRGDHAAAVKLYEREIAIAKNRGEIGDVALGQQNMAIDLYAQGDRVRGADAFASALEAARGLGDRSLEAKILNNQCALLLPLGFPAESRKACEASVKIRKEIDDRADVGKSLMNLGITQMAQGDLKEATASVAESLSALEAVNAKSDAAYARTLLAQLAGEQQKLTDAAKYANDAVTQTVAEKDVIGEAEARTELARVMLASGNVAGARALSDKATELAASSGDRATKLDAAVVAGMVSAKEGKTNDAIATLTATAKDARAAGQLTTEFDARLALGETQMAGGKKTEGRATLSTLAREAKARGFLLIAQKATAAAAG